MASERLDVAILGAGLAGNLLARQLSRAVPGARVGIFDKRVEHRHAVGESVVEIGSNYLLRRLGLSSYLYERQFPKNGLRLFFDSDSRDTPLPEMSEIGSESLPFHPAFQVDRGRLESDLIEMNSRSGVQVRRGVQVEQLELGEGGRPHRFTVSDEKASESIESRWVVDATGRSRLIARRKGLDEPEAQLDNAAAWGWFEGVADIDERGPAAFRQRVRYTARRLSTLHFLYRGYWIWFIPLRDGLTSVGVVCERPRFDAALRSKQGLLDFLGRHAAVASLLENAKPITTGSLDHLAYGTRRFVSAERWALVGEAAAFPDPLYSPGTDFIALENDFASDLIARDLAGAPEDELCEIAELYEAFLRFRLEAAMRIYRDQYPVLGSYEACKLKWDFDVACYHNLWLSPYLLDQHLELRELRRQLAQRNQVLAALSNFAALFRKVEATLSARGEYHRRNQGEYSNGRDCLGFLTEVGLPRAHGELLERTAEIFNAVWRRSLELLEGRQGASPREPRPLTWFASPRQLDA